MTDNRFKTKGRVKLVKSSILNPENSGLRFILSVTNTAGKAENPLYPLFDKKWKRVKEDAKGWYTTKTGAYKLGATNVTAVQSDAWVIHMLVQDDNLKTDSKALETCLKKVCKDALYEKASVHISMLLVNEMPELQELATKLLVDNGVSVSYYEELN